MPYYGIEGGSGGGGGGSTGPNQQVIWQDQKQLTGTYSTGGINIDLSSAFSTINFANIQVQTPASLPAVRFHYNISAATLNIQFYKIQYTKVTAIGNVTNQPSGVTVQSSSGQTSSSESAHTHSIDHDHPSFSSAAPTAGGAGVTTVVLGPNMTSHTHTLDLPNFTGTSGAGTSHNHTDNTIYEHGHSVTQPATSMDASTQLANGTSLSGVIVNLFATGVSL